jgi:hypothetical protein
MPEYSWCTNQSVVVRKNFRSSPMSFLLKALGDTPFASDERDLVLVAEKQNLALKKGNCLESNAPEDLTAWHVTRYTFNASQREDVTTWSRGMLLSIEALKAAGPVCTPLFFGAKFSVHESLLHYNVRMERFVAFRFGCSLFVLHRLFACTPPPPEFVASHLQLP